MHTSGFFSNIYLALYEQLRQPIQGLIGVMKKNKLLFLLNLLLPFAGAQTNEILKPFYHGVASGDPLPNAVVIWTRLTPTQPGNLQVNYEMATDTGFKQIVKSGSVQTGSWRDYTVKVDVTGLNPNTTYYYRFIFSGAASMIGRTKTAPAGSQEKHLRFAVVSCSNYQAGFFNAYGRIADRNDLAAVIHLGDYIYEYPASGYGNNNAKAKGRKHDTLETITLEQYRARYSLYRLDSQLMRMHQQHPMICIWDDHESTNDSYKDGAENHTEGTEGTWENRKRYSRQAYQEWLPIREKADSTIYRYLAYGDLVDLYMLDTRITGRDKQINDVKDPALYASTRTMLGTTQRDWLLSSLQSSKAKWRIIGNQVIFSEFHVGWAAQATGQTPEQTESQFLDIWDGYPYERALIMQTIEKNRIPNCVFLTGDFHCSFAFDVADSVTKPNSSPLPYAPSAAYNANTGKGSVAVEFAAPSITSANFDENVGSALALGFQNQINNDLPIPFPAGYNPNPHMKYVDLIRHGYFLLDVQEDSVSADYFYVDSLLSLDPKERFGMRPYTKTGTQFLQISNKPTLLKSKQDIPAPPKKSASASSVIDKKRWQGKVYPNPARTLLYFEGQVQNGAPVDVQLFDYNGKLLAEKCIRQHHGLQSLDISTYPKGLYFVRFSADGQELLHKIVLQ